LTRTALALAFVPLTTIVLVFLAPSLSLFWTSVQLAEASGPHPLLVERGWWFWVNASYAYACVLLASVLLLRAVLGAVRAFTAQGIALVLAVILPWHANVLTLAGVVPPQGIDLTPPTIVASAALMAYAVLRLGALDLHPGIVPEAREAVFEEMRDGILVVDAGGRVLDANRAADELLAFPAGHLLGRRIEDVLLCEDDPQSPRLTMASLTEATSSVVGTGVGEGGERSLEVVVSRLGSTSRASGCVLAMRDITERRRLQEKLLLHRALHDDLTGLPNRRLLQEQLDQLLKLAKRRDEDLSLLMIDLDRFKEINDTLGHRAGDDLLVIMGERLLSARRESDVVARLGGDEFAVILPVCGERDAVRLAAALRAELMAPFKLRRQQVSVSAAIGVATSPAHGRSPETLLRHADVALYAAKESLDGVAAYRSERDRNSPERLSLLSDLRKAIESGDLELHFQPEVELPGERVVRLEALARWRRDTGEVVPPGEFIPLAEEHGLMPALTRWVLAIALDHCAAAQKAGYEVAMAVNLSALDLQDRTLPKRIAFELERTGLRPEHLWLEVTESSVMHDHTLSRRLLTELRKLGVCVAVDDFGAGQSSLAYLRTLPASDVKIARSFVHRLGSEAHDRAIVESIVQLVHQLGLSVTAEGVEDARALEYLRRRGCDCAQGCFIARPMPFEELLTWLGEHSPRMSEASARCDPPECARR
jgi:diguanylate cyclase (GGDEF)-like protein/PAS domain S-box-containing protein